MTVGIRPARPTSWLCMMDLLAFLPNSQVQEGQMWKIWQGLTHFEENPQCWGFLMVYPHFILIFQRIIAINWCILRYPLSGERNTTICWIQFWIHSCYGGWLQNIEPVDRWSTSHYSYGFNHHVAGPSTVWKIVISDKPSWIIYKLSLVGGLVAIFGICPFSWEFQPPNWLSHMEVSQNGGTPIAGWFMMENPLNMDDFGVPPFQETSTRGLAQPPTIALQVTGLGQIAVTLIWAEARWLIFGNGGSGTHMESIRWMAAKSCTSW